MNPEAPLPKKPSRWQIALLGLSLAACQATVHGQTASPTGIDFGLQIRPILSEHCFHCHGPDPAHRQADLRLDDETIARSMIQPGNALQSELWRRINSADPDQVMPPPSARKTVTPAQQELLKRWIDEGAAWGPHWSLSPPARRPLPDASSDPWSRTTLDAWVLASLQAQNLKPSPPADPYTLVRRIHLDVIGLPPSATQVQRFVQESNIDRHRAVVNLVDELLRRPEFGEHWARMWLDLARYADTKGYEKDLKRDMWPYRDWVIDALNRDMPFDQFTIEQLAGDLLESPSLDQRIATAFHRATLSNDEGGTDDEEYRVAAVKDRIDTTIQVWMGLTMGCAKCHSHKYDPITIEDYYRFYAVFNQTEDADRYDDEPRISLPTFAQQSELVRVDGQRQLANQFLSSAREAHAAAVEARWQHAKPIEATAESQAAIQIEPDRSLAASPDRPERDTYIVEVEPPTDTMHHVRIEALLSAPTTDQPNGLLGLNPADPNFVINEFVLERGRRNDEGTWDWAPVPLSDPKASFEQAGWSVQGAIDGDPKTGWAIAPKQRQSHWAIFAIKTPLQCSHGERLRVTLVQQFGGRLMMRRFRIATSSALDGPLWVDAVPEVESAAKALESVEKQLASLRDSVAKLPVIKELAPNARRMTRVHQRGSFLDPGAEVMASILPLYPSDLRMEAPTRLHAAMWLVDANNPLTPRVMANRIWSQIFGRGIVETEEDFGSQGALPSHPELLDELAIQFRDEFDWSIKRLIKAIVLSNTYQQSFVFDDSRRDRDPQNRYFSRSSRFRLTAEVVRDQALAVAGLLSSKRGGPPVMPPQPDGLWRSTYSGAKWITSPGEDRFRRGIYTFWKRTTPYPSMETFDATTREVCQIRRIATNTPLQALVTLNDPVYVEAALAMAQQWLQSSSSDTERLEQGFLHAMSRPISDTERKRLLDLLARSRLHYAMRTADAARLLESAAFPLDSTIAADELAAWSTLTSTVLNLDEFLMRP
ncbi:MAG: PSD1 and planctomycete cytochrome C domain-containing protein [Planctomycetota bacterium]